MYEKWKICWFSEKKQKTIVICTDNAKKVGGHSIPKGLQNDGFDKTKIYIRRDLRHEAVHVAQSCNNGLPLGIAKEKNIKLHPNKLAALENSTKISGKREKEYEAYWMEDRP